MDAHRERTGQWPVHYSGRIPGEPFETWSAVDAALFKGARGLAGRSSLSRVLEQHRGVPKGYRFSPLTVDRILASMDEHHRQTGWWPNLRSGAVAGAEGENWGAIDTILRTGGRGLPAGSSLAKLRAANGARCADAAELPLLTVETILAWADAHHEGCDRWPDERSGPVYHAAGEIWAEINEALHEGTRGLPGGTSLVELLVAHRGAPRRLRRETLTVEQILAWADRYHDQIGKWPALHAGVADERSGLTWTGIDSALRRGLRGLPAGSSLHKLLVEHRGVP